MQEKKDDKGVIAMTKEILKKALEEAHYNKSVIDSVLRGDTIYIFGKASEIGDEMEGLEYEIVNVDGEGYFLGVEH